MRTNLTMITVRYSVKKWGSTVSDYFLFMQMLHLNLNTNYYKLLKIFMFR